MENPLKLDSEIVWDACRDYGQHWNIGTMQTVLYVAVGGGMIGRLFAEQPADAYIDSRVGKRPYTRKQIENLRQVLCILAESKGLDPHSLPKMPDFHGSGVF